MSRRRARHEDHDEHPGEAWLIALADMMTLLMVTFLMMFAISSLDLKKFQTFKEAFAKGTGTVLPQLPGEGVPTVGEPTDKPLAPKDGTPVPQASAWAAVMGGKVLDAKALHEMQERIEQQIVKAGLADKVEARITARGLVLYVTDAVLFRTAEADVTPQGTALLDALAPALKSVGNDLVVEGHTDKRPIHSARFASNWELSALRATNVARRLVETDGVAAGRVSIAGYGSTRPRLDAATEQAYAANRRVEIVVETPTRSAVPAPAPTAPPATPPGAAVGASPAATPLPAARRAPARH